MPFSPSNGIELYYEVHGAGVPIVFSHGLGGNHLCWWHQVPALRNRYQVITYDLRSFGTSGDDGRQPVDLATDLEGLIDHLKLQKVVVVGQSLGGFAAGGFAARHPDRVLALILSSSAGGFAAIKPPPPKDPDAIKKALSSYEELVKYTLHQDDFAKRDPKMFFLYEQIAGLNLKTQPLRALGMGGQRNDLKGLREHRVPIMIMSGDEDPPHVRAAIDEVVSQAPDIQHEIIPHAGHLTFFEQPELYNRHLLSFLDKHVRSS